MSLVSLTFGRGREEFSVKPHIQITRPEDRFASAEGIENRFEVLRVCNFYKIDDLYIVGKIISGVVEERMTTSINGRKCEVVELECKYRGAEIAGTGMTVGLLVRGPAKGDVGNGEILTFSNS